MPPSNAFTGLGSIRTAGLRAWDTAFFNYTRSPTPLGTRRESRLLTPCSVLTATVDAKSGQVA